MPLTPNTRLGPYEVLSSLGVGGMGEVYRARDTRLDREVAIKVLPAHLTRTVEFKQRFEREAKAISQLTHPHVCTLFDVGHHDGTDYLVMELLEGESLAQRLTKGALPIDETLRRGAEVAAALDAAHRKGVVHRDLKPGNVMLTKGGAKLLDFGLAKSAAVMDSDPSAVTVSQPLTTKGTILGTFQYMAPEQLEGSEADARTDIFALGAVLYEMTTGKRAFEGNSRASLIASIMTAQPRAVSEISPMSPPALDRLIRKCLAKDPDARWQSAGDVADELRWIGEGGSQASAQVMVSRRQGSRSLAWTIAGVCLVAAVVTMVANSRKPEERPVPFHATIVPPENTTLVPTSIFAGPVVVSPDGTQLAFVARRGEGRTTLWVRPLRSSTALALEGTEGAARPFWSADGRSLGFFAGDKLKRVPSDGGPIQSLADASEARGGTWSRDGVIVFAPQFNGPLFAVPSSGGVAAPVTSLDENRRENTHRYPHFLPDGRHFLFLSRNSAAGAGEEPAIMVGSLDSKETKTVARSASNVAYASGHLLYVREGTLVAQPFDVKRREVVGDAQPVVSDLLVDDRFSLGVFSVSQNGVLAYQIGKEQSLFQLTWMDRAGKRLGAVGDPERYYPNRIELSPAGNRVAVGVLDSSGVSDIWLLDLERDIRSKFTIGGHDESSGIWSPDGAQLVYGANTVGREAVLAKKSTLLPGEAQTVFRDPGMQMFTSSWSSDGAHVLCGAQSLGGSSDILVVSLGATPATQYWNQTKHDESGGTFSPDGKWIAYESNESGRYEIYVGAFPGPGGKIQISAHGGTEPRWRTDGKELYYFAPDNRLMAVEIAMEGGAFDVGKVEPLFQSREAWLEGSAIRYDVSDDGQRFLVIAPVTGTTASTISLIVNWPEELTGK